MSGRRCFLSAAICCLLAGSFAGIAAAQEETPQPQGQAAPPQAEPGPAAPKPAPPKDAFFAGSVAELTPDHVLVSRVVHGKAQKHTFHLTPATRVEGRLRLKVRVTVRYQTLEEGDTATMIIVRSSPKSKK
jgi:hypothetical protein